MLLLTHSCLCTLILKMYCPKEKLFLMGFEQQSPTGPLLNYITTLDFYQSHVGLLTLLTQL